MASSVKFFRRRWLVPAAIVLFGATWLVWRAVSRPPAPHYLSAPVQRADIEQSVLASGVLRPIRQVAIGAQVNGQIRRLDVKLGDRVRRGQLLAEIDPVLQQNDLRKAEASLRDVTAQRQAKAEQLKQYQHEEQRQAYMLQRDASSQANYEVAKANVDTTVASLTSLDAQIDAAKVAVDSARANLGYTRIVAPMDGDVISIVAQEGQTVVSAQTAPVIMILADVDTMTVRAKISEADVVRVKPGLPVHFTILGMPDHRFDATLRSVEPAPESIVSEVTQQQYQQSPSQTTTAVYYNGLFDVPNPQHVLRTSMTAQVSIVLGEARQVLTVPMAALRTKLGDGRYEIAVLDAEGRAETRRVSIGLTSDTNAQVLDGLTPGTQVIVGDAAPDGKPSGQGTP
ncbi:macrolide transporter subunit MacA [Burkholderia gladioli]|uniref:macrolide transporter subunit MacA n=1 Tax=Burkholderia gladioli TaxID=28095 RepID=UPI00064A7B31|nr:macrolide transporter subunit MacA [Burkholderia gladioli]MDA0576220.1 macrolide transporter subunit MacA [Burkholderia gladioli]MDA0604315.1 macrolide transporter subunit MacA [Burkholderia gladioli]